MEVIKPFALQLITPECFDEFFVKFNFLDAPCLKALISKGLGLGIVAGSMLVKVPQILKIVSSESAEGINFSGVLLELFAISATVSYNFRKQFPFSAWGDGAFLAFQTALIGALVLYYGGKTAKGGRGKNAGGNTASAIAFFSAYGACLAALLSPLAPTELLWALQAANIPVVFCSKMVQAVSNYRAQSTGQLSALTTFMLFAGSLARIFTSIQETGDTTIIATYIVATFANAIIAFQMWRYWNNKSGSSNRKSGSANRPKNSPRAKKTN